MGKVAFVYSSQRKYLYKNKQTNKQTLFGASSQFTGLALPPNGCPVMENVPFMLLSKKQKYPNLLWMNMIVLNFSLFWVKHGNWICPFYNRVPSISFD